MPDTRVSITDITILSGKKKGFKLNVNGTDVTISVDEAVFAHYQNQFVRKNPTDLQRKAFSTLMALMRAAYVQGRDDARRRS